MELNRVEPEDSLPLIESILKTSLNGEEMEELIEGMQVEIEDGTYVYSILQEDGIIGFLLATPLSDEDEDGENIELISIEDIWLRSEIDPSTISDNLALELKKLAKNLSVPQTEIIVSQQLKWLNESLNDQGFIVSEVKLEKLLPRANNLNDVLDLIADCTPVYRIVQVLLEKENQFMAEIIDEADEIEDLLRDGWEPVMVIVTFEPDDQDIDEIIEESNGMINWDDYSIVYYT